MDAGVTSKGAPTARDGSVRSEEATERESRWLKAALVDAASQGNVSTNPNVQQAICAFVDAAKHAGWRPEQAVRRVKELAHDAGLSLTRYREFWGSIGERDDALRAVVGSCIERFFANP
jgi:hypothetical protein